MSFDLANQDPFALLKRIYPTHVLYNTALSRVRDAEDDPERAHCLNHQVPERVARWCAEHDARITFVSTDLVFGERDAPEGGFSLDATPGPLHVYGRTKAAGEAAVLKAHPQGAAVVRLPLLFGPSCGAGVGASDSLLAAIDRGEHPGLFTDEFRTPLDVRDAAAATIECLRARRVVGLVHVAGPERISRFELGRRVLRAHGWSAQDIDRVLRPTTRAAAGLAEQRAGDVSLDASWARDSLETRLRGIDEALADRLPG